MIEFLSSTQIRACAEELIGSLNDLKDARGEDWTNENFKRLTDFSKSKIPDIECYYRQHGKKSEFLWDFIASTPRYGIFIAAESEQAIHRERDVIALKHDFEKLLYVYSPIKLLITKARHSEDASRLAEELASYAADCCLNLNPGAVLILHFGLYNDAGSRSFVWQAPGEPQVARVEKIDFRLSTKFE